MPDEIATDILELKRDKVYETVKRRAENGEDPLKILGECRQGMTMVGDGFQEGQLFLSDMMMAAEIFKSVVAILEPYQAMKLAPEPIGKVVLATLRGDIHDLGKDIFATLLKARGFEVHNLGVDVDPTLLLEKVKEVKPDFVGLSVLITSAFASIEEAVKMLEEVGLRNTFKLMVGGGVTTPLLKEHFKADFQTRDANEGVMYCMKEIGGKK